MRSDTIEYFENLAAGIQTAPCVEIAREAVDWARDLCQGVHLMTLGHEDKIPEILA